MKKKLIDSMSKEQLRTVVKVFRPHLDCSKMNKTKCIAIVSHYSFNAIKKAMQ